jgi:dipeptidyl aminopeptidase/acylaminoacyl peptidase
MQDDVADATTWAVDKGYSDAKHVCIAGASYGGYATLMGLIRFPEMYRCGVEWVGVSDIDLMYDISWSDTGDTSKKFGMPVMIGDQVKDAAQLAKTSPVKRAAEIKQPLLMAYGGYDVRVPIKHGNVMRDAMKKTNPNVEFVEYPLEGHGWTRDDSNADWWGRVEKFLDKNLKNAP